MNRAIAFELTLKWFQCFSSQRLKKLADPLGNHPCGYQNLPYDGALRGLITSAVARAAPRKRCLVDRIRHKNRQRL